MEVDELRFTDKDLSVIGTFRKRSILILRRNSNSASIILYELSSSATDACPQLDLKTIYFQGPFPFFAFLRKRVTSPFTGSDYLAAMQPQLKREVLQWSFSAPIRSGFRIPDYPM
jgi:hypothetical protein